ncbi:MAG TPA: ABC transporter ATP-binding protein [Candidatus Saccharimonadales bacterium]|nr:ABC transporter ATP-binding protein [Candidatus Saccharimonadales bacterium]
MKNIWRLFELVPRYKARLLKVVLVNSILGFAGLAIPYVFRNLLNIVVASVRTGWSATVAHKIFWSLGLMFGIYVVNAFFDYIAERLSDFLFIDVIWEIRRAVFKHLTSVSIDYYEQNRSGEILSRINTGTMDFGQWVMGLADGVLGSVLMTIFVVTFLWIKIPAVGIIMTISLPINFYWAISKVIKTKALRQEWHKHTEKGMGEMTETISQITTVRSFAQEKYKFDRYLTAIDGYRDIRLKQARVEWWTNYNRAILNSVTIVLALGVTAYGVLTGHNSVGDVALVSWYLLQIRGTINPLSRTIINTGDLETSAERLVHILNVKPTVVDAADAKPLPGIESIEFQDVSFHYPGKATDVLRGISFKLAKGQKLALVGPSGVGKTTVTKLLMRFYAPTGGEILINGQPIENFSQNSIREKVGTVMQDVALFNDTIEENLRFAKPEASAEELAAATKIAHADNIIDKLPDGLQTLVGERGIKLSGGEKQRIAIARAVLRDPQLIILDEATSSLDSESEKFVQDGLEKLMKNRTAVMIAHRLSTIQKADQILVLDNGKIVERGTHRDLVKNQQLYARFLSLQTTTT